MIPSEDALDNAAPNPHPEKRASVLDASRDYVPVPLPWSSARERGALGTGVLPCDELRESTQYDDADLVGPTKGASIQTANVCAECH